jgi:mannose-6-phosphate isomerase
MGSHPGGPASVKVGGTTILLPQLLAQATPEILGAAVAGHRGAQLPYLFKVLDARQMLSIQAHPTLEQAAAGFEREEAAGIPLTAATRNYKDRNHKPEVHVALTDFWMLHGFRPLEEIATALDRVTGLSGLVPDFRARLAAAGADPGRRGLLLRRLYERAMTMPQDEADTLLNPLIAQLEKHPVMDKDDPAFWALRAAREFPLPGGHRDRGIFSIYLLNLVRLKPGEGTFQPAGTLHAYLEGVNVELMANSDNVLRGGLTPKHVDVAELMRVVKFEPGLPQIIQGGAVTAVETVFPTPATEFQLSRVRLQPGQAAPASADHGVEILLTLEGCGTVHSAGAEIALSRGAMVLAPHGVDYTVAAGKNALVLFKAGVPQAR